MRKILFIFAILSFFAISRCYGQVDSCLMVVGINDSTVINPNQAKQDTCVGSPTYLQYYSQYGYEIHFRDYVLDLAYSEDTVYAEWSDIDTAEHALRDSLESLQDSFGHYVLQKKYPKDTSNSSPYSRQYMIRFDRYVCADSVTERVTKIHGIDFYEFYQPEVPLSISPEKGIGATEYILSPNAANNYFTLIPSDKTISGLVSVRIFDQRGVVVATERVDISSENKINVSSLASGVYQVYCDDAKVGNLVIQK